MPYFEYRFCLALRRAPSDLVFLATDSYAPEIVATLLDAFIRRFGADGGDQKHAKDLDKARAALQQAQEKMATAREAKKGE